MEDIRAAPLVVSSGNVANAPAVATLVGDPGKVAHLSGFQINGTGATASSIVVVTVTGLQGDTLVFPIVVVAGVLLPNAAMNMQFNVGLPASGPDVDIVITCPALGAGNTNNAVNAQGFQI